jgi:hypothetical protein
VAPPVFKTGLAANIVAGGFDSLPPPPGALDLGEVLQRSAFLRGACACLEVRQLKQASNPAEYSAGQRAHHRQSGLADTIYCALANVRDFSVSAFQEASRLPRQRPSLEPLHPF